MREAHDTTLGLRAWQIGVWCLDAVALGGDQDDGQKLEGVD